MSPDRRICRSAREPTTGSGGTRFGCRPCAQSARASPSTSAQRERQTARLRQPFMGATTSSSAESGGRIRCGIRHVGQSVASARLVSCHASNATERIEASWLAGSRSIHHILLRTAKATLCDAADSRPRDRPASGMDRASRHRHARVGRALEPHPSTLDAAIGRSWLRACGPEEGHRDRGASTAA